MRRWYLTRVPRCKEAGCKVKLVRYEYRELGRCAKHKQKDNPIMQLITFTPPDLHLWIGQAERLRCSVYVDDNRGIAITGEKDVIFQIVERLSEDGITFQRFVSLEGRITSEGRVFW
jgi:hypothetical protein